MIELRHPHSNWVETKGKKNNALESLFYRSRRKSDPIFRDTLEEEEIGRSCDWPGVLRATEAAEARWTRRAHREHAQRVFYSSDNFAFPLHQTHTLSLSFSPPSWNASSNIYIFTRRLRGTRLLLEISRSPFDTHSLQTNLIFQIIWENYRISPRSNRWFERRILYYLFIGSKFRFDIFD